MRKTIFMVLKLFLCLFVCHFCYIHKLEIAKSPEPITRRYLVLRNKKISNDNIFHITKKYPSFFYILQKENAIRYHQYHAHSMFSKMFHKKKQARRTAMDRSNIGNS